MTNKCLKAITFCFYWGFCKASPSQKMQIVLFLGCKMGVIVPGSPNRKCGNCGWELNCVLVLREQQLQNAAFCKESFVFPCLTYKNVQRFRNRPVHECYGLKASQMCKVRASSHEYPDVEKIKNLHEQNFEDEANNMQLDKEDIQRSNLNSQYLSTTLVQFLW